MSSEGQTGISQKRAGAAVAVRLDRTYDVDKLVADLEGLRAFSMVTQPGGYHDGEWKGLPLYSPSGDLSWAGTERSIFERTAPTAALKSAPYCAELLEGLGGEIQFARVLALPPGGKIRQHTDVSGIYSGSVRLHVPMVTHPDVDFVIGGQRCEWKAGELWYGDFSQVHSVHNRSAITRYHLVTDVKVTERVLELFPAGDLEAMRALGEIPVAGARVKIEAQKLERYACNFIVPPLPILATLLGGAPRAVPGSISLAGGKLTFSLLGRALSDLVALNEEQFYLERFGPGVVLLCVLRNDRVQSLTLALKGANDLVPLRLLP